MAYLTKKLKADASVVISASFNVKNHVNYADAGRRNGD